MTENSVRSESCEKITVIVWVLLAVLLADCDKTPAKSGGDTLIDTEVITSAGADKPSYPEESYPVSDGGTMDLPSA